MINGGAMLSFLRSLFTRRKLPPVEASRIPGYAIKTLKGDVPNPGTQPLREERPTVQRSDWLPPKGWRQPEKEMHSHQMPKLVLACMGDAEKAKRLALYELRRQPGMSFDVAVSSALQRLQVDRQR